MTILVTGGAGYIGSHTCLELLQGGYDIVVIDNLSNSSRESLQRVQNITEKQIPFYQADILDKISLQDIFTKHSIGAVIHFAGFKAVGESVEKPLEYYHNNVSGSIFLLETMTKFNVKNIVFSSSATVYDCSNQSPLKEEYPLGTINPYGRTKLMIEEILHDLFVSDSSWNSVLLRYFNPIGAHDSGFIGEDPNGYPNNLMPFITQVAVGKRDILSVFGNDYDTPDGTGVRDYIHVVDLAKGHLKALEKLNDKQGISTYNLGTGKGYSVLDVIHTFERVNNVKIPYEIVDRRPGDLAITYADPSKAFSELGWKAEKDLEDMCRDSWNWQKKNPNGYGD